MAQHKQIKLGILLAGETGINMRPHNPSYQEMFTSYLAPLNDMLDITFIHVRHGDFPEQLTDYDAYMISGSRHGVYDDLPWIPRLMDFVKSAYNMQIPLIGVCFGHQLLAHALGGEAVLSDKGWGVGIKAMAMQNDLPEASSKGQSVRLIYMHQDQVISLPAEAEALLGDDFCPYAAFIIPGRVLSFQGHPEFNTAYLSALINRHSGAIGDEGVARATDSLSTPTDNDQVRDWMANFLNHALATQSRAA